MRRPAQAASAAGRRVKVSWPAEIKCHGRRSPCIVTDISAAGASVACDAAALRIGDDVWLIIADVGPVPAAVAWHRRDRVGLQFREHQDWLADVQRKRFDPTAWLSAQ
jgi:hypothetical protein